MKMFIRVVIGLAWGLDLETKQLNIKIESLNDELEEEMQAELPEELKVPGKDRRTS